MNASASPSAVTTLISSAGRRSTSAVGASVAVALLAGCGPAPAKQGPRPPERAAKDARYACASAARPTVTAPSDDKLLHVTGDPLPKFVTASGIALIPGGPPLYVANPRFFAAASSPAIGGQASVLFALSYDGAVYRFEAQDLSAPKRCASLPAGELIDLAVGPSQLAVSTAPPDFGTGRLFVSDLACDAWSEVFTAQEGQVNVDYERDHGLWTLIARGVSGATSLWTSPTPNRGWVRLAQQSTPFLATHAVGPATLVVGSADSLLRVDFTDAGTTTAALSGPRYVTGIVDKPDGGLWLASIHPQSGTVQVTDYVVGLGVRSTVETVEDAFVTAVVSVEGKTWLVGASSTYLDGANVLRATSEAHGIDRTPVLDCDGVAGWKEFDSSSTHIRTQWFPGRRGDWTRAGPAARMTQALPIWGPFSLGDNSMLWGAVLDEGGNPARLVGELTQEHRILFEEDAERGPYLSRDILDIRLRSATPLAGFPDVWHFGFERDKVADAIRVTENATVRLPRPADLGESIFVADPYFSARLMFLDTSHAKPVLRTSLDDGASWSSAEANVESRPLETAVNVDGEPVWRDDDGRLCDLSQCVAVSAKRLLAAAHGDGRTTLVVQTADGVHWRDSIDGDAHQLGSGTSAAIFVFKNVVVTMSAEGFWRELRID